MPLGIPRVPYRRLSTEKPIWIDIYERLYKERVLFLCKEIAMPFDNRFITLLLLLNSGTDIYTASGASLILVSGTVIKRVALPHARVLIHQPSSALIRKNIDGLVMEAEDMLELRNTIADIYAQKTGKPVDVIQKDLERDSFMSATEAQDYGIVNRVAKFKKENPE